jgi:hypothetical protein
MFAHADMRAGRVSGRQRRQFKSVYPVPLVLGIVLLMAGGCSLAPRGPMGAAGAADPHAPVPPAIYPSTIGPYTSTRPVAPEPWRERNERIAPQPKS